MTKKCTCNREHWQPHVESCPAYKPKPLLTVENIRSGDVPSDAVAVGFLLGELDRLTHERDEYKIWWTRDSKNLGTALNDLSMMRSCKQDIEIQRNHWLQITREKDAEIERLTLENQRLQAVFDGAFT